MVDLWDKMGWLGQLSLVMFAVLIFFLIWIDHVINWVESLDNGESEIYDRREPTLKDFKDLVDAVNEERGDKE